MPAGKYDFYVEQGVGKSFSVEYKDSLGQPKDLTGWEARGSVKMKMADCSPIAEFDFTIIPLEGKLEISLNQNAFSEVKLKTNRHDDYQEAVYDVELFRLEDDVEIETIRLLNGVVKISPEVTK